MLTYLSAGNDSNVHIYLQHQPSNDPSAREKKAVIMRKWCHHKYATVDKILRLLNGEGELILKTSKNQGQYPIMHCHGSCAWLLCQYVD